VPENKKNETSDPAINFSLCIEIFLLSYIVDNLLGALMLHYLLEPMLRTIPVPI
jgi:hypothetical protein